ncbi:uncharacterized protein L201_007795 [Kwoniella dendrophila CBS 6074]|uniref:Uncharacterized protein n=1 Tax=Kwoniella dendrophila CBS 6074 TaxID=1295534 RepID=A0AAX4K539_9TREE
MADNTTANSSVSDQQGLYHAEAYDVMAESGQVGDDGWREPFYKENDKLIEDFQRSTHTRTVTLYDVDSNSRVITYEDHPGVKAKLNQPIEFAVELNTQSEQSADECCQRLLETVYRVQSSLGTYKSRLQSRSANFGNQRPMTTITQRFAFLLDEIDDDVRNGLFDAKVCNKFDSIGFSIQPDAEELWSKFPEWCTRNSERKVTGIPTTMYPDGSTKGLSLWLSNTAEIRCVVNSPKTKVKAGYDEPATKSELKSVFDEVENRIGKLTLDGLVQLEVSTP